ncbi:MAG TPA: hypothetical protein VF135_11940 [Terriglobales bacterium]
MHQNKAATAEAQENYDLVLKENRARYISGQVLIEEELTFEVWSGVTLLHCILLQHSQAVLVIASQAKAAIRNQKLSHERSIQESM